ncbi:TetR/AcrR family transcriptional regulator [Streptomyces sp. NBC_01724]|uniref:TetR/AcrR family transcriptional regulator n=1 Tax=unclassified Streptomyces TaxID=2593676 RepID=UPI0028C4AD94|nr:MULTISPECIES: TetR/AcrR family transcriptional regulator [unclassified Streptomyces]WTE50012.1 TetR/AcrR family transcriptional regulator [Streptomyces sp. NBC_01620]WTE58097.1 TetR/AcrR family transcriptional regulator [Streptomyces sp. NBC_01617]WTI85626.1 TetR/AcrR family transcriptional regulator [Streptomyces sp. NBC_00724]WNO63138.1 TetR/AcrR family transcriptional regulator [Streptomyces sp. AM2-3-1]WSC67719.1 TetR/AcrR family transcriptional regulator [Streptomyces sp. NBC_01760]
MAYRPTARTEATRLAHRQRLLDAARQLLAEGGYAAASISALAERAQVATGSVYNHFASKQELLAAVFRHVAGHELTAVQEAVGAKSGAAEQLRALVEVFAFRALRTPRTAWALLAEPVDPLVEAERLTYRRGYHTLAETVITAGIEAGELPAQNARLSAAAVIGAISEALLGPLSPVGERTDPEPVVTGIATLCLRAVGAVGT